MSKFNPHPLQIALWGPADSGKTRLKEMLRDSLLQSYQHPILELIIEQDDEQEKVRASNLLDREYWTFWNVGRKAKNTDYRNDGINVSSLWHELEIFDPPGAKVFRSDDYQYLYKKADLVILVLDPTQSPLFKKEVSFSVEKYSYPAIPLHDKEDDVDLSEFVKQSIFFQRDPAIGQKTVATSAREDISDYFDRVQNVLTMLQYEKRPVAVCITKMDLLPISDRQLKQETILQKYFGEGMKSIFSQRLDWDIGHYSVPTAEDKLYEPNGIYKKLHTNSLVIPVLKLLEARERAQIEKQSGIFSKNHNLKIYIPYLGNGFV